MDHKQKIDEAIAGFTPEQAAEDCHNALHNPTISAGAMLALIKVMRENDIEMVEISIHDEDQDGGVACSLDDGAGKMTFVRVPETPAHLKRRH